MVLITGFFDILPKDMKSPRGSEKISVTKKIWMLIHIPPVSCEKIFVKVMVFPSYLLHGFKQGPGPKKGKPLLSVSIYRSV